MTAPSPAVLVPSSAQEDLRSVVRGFLGDHAPMSSVRAVVDGGGYDPTLWPRLAGELGLASLVVPEELGGAGAGHADRAVVLEELGRALTPSPFFASAVLAVDLLVGCGDHPLRNRLLERIGSGDTTATVAVAEGDGPWPAAASTTARAAGDTWLLSGVKTPVLDGATARDLLVHARTADGPALFLVDGGAPGLSRTPLRTLDPTRPLATLTFTDVPARAVLPCADPEAAVRHATDLAAVALAAEQLGGLARAAEMAVEHARQRVQFGRPIGSFQAVKHGCADSYVEAELAVSVVRHAAWTADEDPAGLPRAAAVARAVVSPAYFRVAARTIQLHGGIGYTWEHPAHLYYRRARSSEYLLGDPASARAALARQFDPPILPE